MADMLSVEQAQSRVIALASPVDSECVSLAHAAGRWLAEPVVASRTQPENDLSAMDGYAIRFQDLSGPLSVIGESAAGAPFEGTVGPAQAVRIFTGAVVPSGADTILVQEDATRSGNGLILNGDGPANAGAHIRRRGLDFSSGEILIEAGERLSASRIGLAAISGHGTLNVARPVRIAIATTGDELVPPGQPVGPGQLPEGNGAMIAALLRDLPVETISLGILPDSLNELTRAFSSVEADVLVTIGGASVGDHDLVRPALQAAGANIDFWRVAMRPGKPMMAGRMRDLVTLGLPGNPVSCFVTATLFLRPLVAALSGAAHPLPKRRTVPLGKEMPANSSRADFVRATLNEGHAHPFEQQDSSMLRTLVQAEVLIIRPPNVPAAHIGDSVEILDLS